MEPAVSGFVEQFAGFLVEAGMPRMASRVFVRLLVSDEGRLTAAELSDDLLISPAAVSGAVRYLIQVDMVVREREPGGRKDVYRLHGNAWYEAISSRDKLLAKWIAALADGMQAVGPDTDAGQRLAETREFFAFLVEELDGMFERWRARQSGPGRG